MTIQVPNEIYQKLEWLETNLEISREDIIELAIKDFYQVHYGIDQEGENNGEE